MEHIGAEVWLVMAVTQVAEDILFQDSSSKSSCIENSESEEDDLSAVVLSLLKEDHPKQTGYLAVVTLYSDRNFWRHFRVSRSTFNRMLHY